MNPIDRPRILVVDDDEGARRTLALILERKGYDVVTAGTTHEALERANDGRFHVGLLDIRLPDGKGVDLLSPLKELHPEMGLIMVTGYASSETAIRALNEGATAYITKPLNLDEVLAEVRKVMEKQQLVAEKREAEEQVDHVNAVLRAIRSVNQLIVREKDRSRLIQGACESLVETRGYLSAFIALQGAGVAQGDSQWDRQGETAPGQIAPEQFGPVTHVAAAGLDDHTRELRARFQRGQWPACARRALDELDVVITDASPASCMDCSLARSGDVESGMAAPLKHNGNVYGVLMVTAATAFAGEEEVLLFREVADDIALGLYGIGLEEQRENHVRELRLIADTVVTGSRTVDVGDMCELIAEAVQGVNEGSHVLVTLYDQSVDAITIRALEGFEEKAGQVLDILGLEVGDAVAPPDQMAGHTAPDESAPGKITPMPGGLYDVLAGQVPRSACQEVERLLGVGKTYTVDLALGGEPRGSLTILVPQGQELGYRSAIETLASHFLVLLQRRQAEEALRESEARYRALFNNAGDATFIYDLTGHLLAVNEVACEQLGYSRDGLLQTTVGEIEAPEHAPEVLERIADLQRRGHLVFETSHIQRDGTRIPVEVSSRLIEYRGQQAVLSAARDISDRLEMEHQLHRQERLAAVGQLAGGIAHDFRNFLTTIILYAGMPLAQPDLSPETQEALEVIAGEAQQASDLVQQILDFSGRSVMEKQPVDLVEFIEEAADILRQTIPESIRVDLALEPDTGFVEADPTRIQQVLMNLALNARDAMTAPRPDRTAEGGELEIALSKVVVPVDQAAPVPGMAPGEWVRLTVSDTGTGMSEEVKERIFEPFFTTKERGEGTGLGLAQVYGIVQQHSGHIDVETELGVGTAFHVYLPVHQAEAAEALERASPPLLEGREELVLLVEDQENLREAGRGMLTSLGYRVMTAANGQEALEMLEGVRVDLVVTDVVMPKMGGKSLMREIARVSPDLPVLAVTGYTMEEELRELREVGFFDVLQKPFDPPSLAQAVRHALDREQA